MYRLCLLCLCMVCMGQVSYAQQQQPFPFKLYDTGKVFIRISPLGIFDFTDENLSVGGEYHLNDTWALTMDAAWIFYSQYFQTIKSASGFIVRPGIRAYVNRYKDYFFELQLHYKRAVYNIHDWLGREVVGGTASYEQLTDFRYQRQALGAYIIGGSKKEFMSERLRIEFYLGLGVHYRWEGLLHEPNSNYTAQTSNISNGIHYVPVVPCGIRISFRIR